MAKVFVMMSGGVDSSVAAAELKEAGHEVIGVFMKCWSIEQLESLQVSNDLYGCFWEEDSNDARLVADKLGIPFYVWNFEEEYKQKVVNYMLDEYRQGRTPNPDVMCNSVIKFGIFYQRARQLGAEFVATGHYTRIINENFPAIARGADSNKDQSYFLWKIKQEQIPFILFPIGEFATKAEVRQKAESLDLITAKKPDSQGLCFIGTTPLRELLLQVVGEKSGEIIDSTGKILGQHKGAYLFTIGQRFGLGLSGGPWFVTKIDVDKNQVTVANQLHEESLYGQELVCTELNWQVDLSQIKQYVLPVSTLGPTQNLDMISFSCEAQIRYRQSPMQCEVQLLENKQAKVTFQEPIRAIAKGQSIVFYQENIMLGGGVIR